MDDKLFWMQKMVWERKTFLELTDFYFIFLSQVMLKAKFVAVDSEHQFRHPY